MQFFFKFSFFPHAFRTISSTSAQQMLWPTKFSIKNIYYLWCVCMISKFFMDCSQCRGWSQDLSSTLVGILQSMSIPQASRCPMSTCVSNKRALWPWCPPWWRGKKMPSRSRRNPPLGKTLSGHFLFLYMTVKMGTTKPFSLVGVSLS